MAPGNGTPHDGVGPVPPRSLSLKEQAAARGLTEARPPAPEASRPIVDFMARVDHAASLLQDIGEELGQVGEDDAKAMKSFANTMQQHVHSYVTQLVERKRRELADLERILGKL